MLLPLAPLDAPLTRRFEIVERKGLCDPDSICAALPEKVSQALGRLCANRFGKVPHRNAGAVPPCGYSSKAAFRSGAATAPRSAFAVR